MSEMKPCPECQGTGEVTEEAYDEIMSDRYAPSRTRAQDRKFRRQVAVLAAS